MNPTGSTPTGRVTREIMLISMSNRHGRRHRDPGASVESIQGRLRHEIASKLRVDPDRIRYAELPTKGRYGTEGAHWQIFYLGEWRELPWHFEGPMNVTRAMVRQWWGEESET